jgi:recombinational DNA repair protein RecR
VNRRCVVAHDGDTAPGWDGDYHALGALLDPIEGIGPDKLDLAPAFAADAVAIHLGDSFTGAATAMWLEERLRERGIRVLSVHPTGETLKNVALSGW